MTKQHGFASLKVVYKFILMVVVMLPDPFRGLRAWRNSAETQQLGHAPSSGPEVKNGRSCAKNGARMRDSPGGVESYPAEGVRRRCTKILLPFYPA